MARPLYSTLGVGLCIILALAALLQNLVARPIARMTRHALHVGEQDDLEARLDMRRRDEIGLLANELDRMVGRMAKARKRLALQNYAAGLAEMAAETLHNARNAMAPAVARLDSMRHSLRDLGLDRVGAALDELLAGTADAPRRDGLRRYVSLSTQRAQTAWSDVCAGLDEVNAHLSRMETLLERAETASRIQAPRARINSRELLEEALLAASPEKMASTSPALQPPGDSGASMIFEAPRATLLRALILLIECAAQTLRQACAEDRRILLSVGPSDSPGRPGVMYCIAMPGLERSTQDCHSLFARDDLSNGNASSTAHLCANAAMAMNGRLAAETGREGRGVSFHLWLPRE